jgi:hypothetical protein
MVILEFLFLFFQMLTLIQNINNVSFGLVFLVTQVSLTPLLAYLKIGHVATM